MIDRDDWELDAGCDDDDDREAYAWSVGDRQWYPRPACAGSVNGCPKHVDDDGDFCDSCQCMCVPQPGVEDDGRCVECGQKPVML